MHSRAGLVDDFRSLGVEPGDVIMLHASVRSIGEVAGGPDEIHLALKEALTEAGTLMMYAGCPRYVDEVGRGGLTPALEAEVLELLPPFDAETARSARDHGVLVEFLRTYPGSRVNHHPARFVAWGEHTEALFATQPWDYAFGRGSALERFEALDGKVLLLGSDHHQVTFLHYVEHVIDLPDRRIAHYKVPVLRGGERVWRDVAEFDTSSRGVHPHWPDRFFARIVDSYLRETANQGGAVGACLAFLLSSRGLHRYAGEAMGRVASDPGAAARFTESAPKIE
ncbi:MAG TPA: AAC(3) family N-acetyltransferase [Longimicrobiales bacterium]|nr:AAC(3) family N-acetyltransferase [Longimicrobiales bacterium]